MKIAQVAPLYEDVPPKLYGGTERVVSYLTEALVDMGHEVTLFCSGESQTRARKISVIPKALRLDRTVVDPLAPHFVQQKMVMDMAEEFDVIHFHTDYLHFPVHPLLRTPSVNTLHGRLDYREWNQIVGAFPNSPLISISMNQRKPLPDAHWIGNVYHGLPVDLYRCVQKKEKYVAFIGRISPEKRVDRAIEIAGRLGLPIKIAAKIDKADEAYYEEKIKPLFRQSHVEYIGEIGEKDKNEFLGNALALLFPIDWPEPFGMVMIEAMACGTPVLAFRNGSVPEVIDEGKTGIVVDSMDEAVSRFEELVTLRPENIRKIFEKRFSSLTMAANYSIIYKLLQRKEPKQKEAVDHAPIRITGAVRRKHTVKHSVDQ